MRMIWVVGLGVGAGGLRAASAGEPERYAYKVLWGRGGNPWTAWRWSPAPS
jgi:hypothetical protein